MSRRLKIVLGLVAAVVAAGVSVAVVTAGKPEPACGCSIEPNLRGPAHDAAVRFEALALRADVNAAWAVLTDEARSRYGDVAGFRPVFDRFGTALRKAPLEAGDPAAAGWLAVADRMRRDRPSEVVVVRYVTGKPRVVWPLLVLTHLGRLGEERIDPEPATLRLSATSAPDGVRVKLADGDLNRTSFVAIDSTGRDSLPREEHLTVEEARLTWATRVQGPVVAIAIEKSTTGLRVGAAEAAVG